MPDDDLPRTCVDAPMDVIRSMRSSLTDSPARRNENNPIEIAGTGLFAHPLLESLCDESVGAFRPVLSALGSCANAAAAHLGLLEALDCCPVLYGSSVLTRLARSPIDIDAVVYVFVPVDPVPSRTGQPIRTAASFLRAFADAPSRLGALGELEFLSLNVFVPLMHRDHPGQIKKYCCSWSREDLHIGSTSASLGSIGLEEALRSGGVPMMTFSAVLDGERVLADVRIDAIGGRLESLGPITIDAHHMWAGSLAGSYKSAQAAMRVEEAALRSMPAGTSASPQAQIRESHATARLAQNKPLKSLKYAMQALAFDNRLDDALALAVFLRSRAARCASVGGRLANLITPVRRRCADRHAFWTSAMALRDRANSLLDGDDVPGIPSPPRDQVSRIVERWHAAAGRLDASPRAWAELECAANDLTTLANAPALAFLHENRDRLGSLPKLRAAIERSNATAQQDKSADAPLNADERRWRG